MDIDARRRSFIRITDRVEMWDETEKKFALKLLLEYHAERLGKIIKGTPEPETAKDIYALLMMKEHKRVTDEMISVLIGELF